MSLFSYFPNGRIKKKKNKSLYMSIGACVPIVFMIVICEDKYIYF